MAKIKSARLIIVAAATTFISMSFALAGWPDARERREGISTRSETRLSLIKGGPGTANAMAVDAQRQLSRADRATIISPKTKVDDAEMAIQQEIAWAFAWMYPIPHPRVEHFALLNQPEGEMWIIGWRGTILDMVPLQNGWLIRVRMTAELGSDLGSVCCGDDLDELYEYDAGGLRFLQEIKEPRTRPCVITFQ